jgi:hypothetical protein
MRQLSLIALVVHGCLLLGPRFSHAQVRITPEKSKGGRPWGEPWAEVPETFRNVAPPKWLPPNSLQQWEQVDRLQTRAKIIQCLGEMPARPDPLQVKVISQEDCGEYVLERFEFFNGVDMVVPGVIAIPKNSRGPAPAVIGMHGHSGSKDYYVPDPQNDQSPGWMLVRRGYVVAAIDSYFNGERIGKGPRGAGDRDQEMSLFKGLYGA